MVLSKSSGMQRNLPPLHAVPERDTSVTGASVAMTSPPTSGGHLHSTAQLGEPRVVASTGRIKPIRSHNRVITCASPVGLTILAFSGGRERSVATDASVRPQRRIGRLVATHQRLHAALTGSAIGEAR